MHPILFLDCHNTVKFKGIIIYLVTICLNGEFVAPYRAHLTLDKQGGPEAPISPNISEWTKLAPLSFFHIHLLPSITIHLPCPSICWAVEVMSPWRAPGATSERCILLGCDFLLLNNHRLLKTTTQVVQTVLSKRHLV